MRRVGNIPDVAKHAKADMDLISSFDPDKSFTQWKNKIPPEVMMKMDGRKPYSNHILGLLRFNRNLREHNNENIANVNLMEVFPDLFGRVYTSANSQGWNEMTPLKEMLRTAACRPVNPPTNQDNLSVPVQETQPMTTKQIVA